MERPTIREETWQHCLEVCVLVYVRVYQWRSNHGGSGGWHPRENLRSDVVSRACLANIPRKVFHTNLIALSCSARTDVLSCSQGTDGTDGEILFLGKKLLQFTVSVFSCFVVSSYIIENLPDHDVRGPTEL